jgi:hypothetical protein
MNVGGLPIVLAFGGVESQYWASAGCATKAPHNESVMNKTARLDAMMNLIGFHSNTLPRLERITKRAPKQRFIRAARGKKWRPSQSGA